MDTKHQKRCKHPKKMKASTDDGNAEVFVLPPDLLKKLGISLGNVSNSHGSAPDVEVAVGEINREPLNHYSKSEHTSRSSDDASILETANLMKKSVFLSPTFVSTVANVFPGEMEIASVVEADAPSKVTEIETVDSTTFPLDSTEIANMCIIESATATDKSLIINPTMNGVFTTVSNIEHSNRIQIYNAISTSNNIKVSSSNTTANLVENYTDEEYFMNNGSTMSKHTHDLSQETYPQAQNNLSKINIISEEIIGPSKLKGLKILPNITNLTPVTIDTNIGIQMNDVVHKPFHTASHNSLNLSESRMHKNELITDRNIPGVNCGSKMLNENSTIAGDVTQNNTGAFTEYFPEINMSPLTHGFDNPQVIYNVVKPKVACHKNSNGNSSNQINTEETCDSDIIVCQVVDNTEKNEASIGKLTSAVEDINSFENKDYTNLNVTDNKLPRNEVLYAHAVVDMDVGSKISNVVCKSVQNIKTTFDVKQQDSMVQLNLNSDCNNFNDHESSKITSNHLFCVVADNIYCENKTAHFNSKGNIDKTLECHGDFVGVTTTHIQRSEILYSNENDVLKVDDACKIPKEKKGTLDLLKPNEDITISPDVLSDKMLSLATNDSKRFKINNKEKDDDRHLGINYNILCNGNEVSKNACDDNSHSESNKVIEGRALSIVGNTNDANKDDNGYRNIHLEICGNINYVDPTKELKHTKNVKHVNINEGDSKHRLISNSVSGKTINDYDLNKSKPSVHESNCEVQLDNQKYKNNNKMNNDPSNSTSNTNVEKVKEIAAYLKTLKHIYSDKIIKQKKNITLNNNKHESIGMNPNTMKSKLSIQGVEKPGGIITGNINKLFFSKTYQRRNRLKRQIAPTTNKCFNAESKVTDVSNDEINTAVISAKIRTQEFCICNDFGRLDYYDSDDLYEHIHFCRHHNTHCDLDLILNIYNDDEVVINQKEINNEYITEDDSETVEINICWKDFQYKDKKCCTEAGILDKAAELKHALMDDEKGTHTTSNVDTGSTTDIIISDNDNIVSASNEDVCKPDSIITVKQSMDIATNFVIPSSDFKNPGNGDDISTSCADLYNSNVINFEKDSASHENIHSADWASSKNFNIVSKTDNVLQKNINNEKSDFSVGNVVQDMDNFGDDVISYESHGTEIIIKNEESNSNLDNVKQTDETYDENVHSTTVNEPSEGKEENLSDITKIKAIPNPKQDESTRKLSNKNDKIKRKRSKSAVNAPGSVNDTDEPEAKRKIQCAVCHEQLSEKKWENHIIGQHQFIAWKAGDDFDLDDADLQRKLKQSLKIVGFLKCTFCNLEISKLKKFMEHIRKCMQLKDCTTGEGRKDTATESNVVCGVCRKEVQSSCWLEHIGKYHNYLAWTDGSDPLNLDDEQSVRDHLLQIMKQTGELHCYKCGVTRKRIKAYLSHVESCEGIELDVPSTPNENPNVKCGVCTKEVSNLCWIEHIAKEHNYLAWPDNSQPLKLDDKEAVWEHLQQFIRNYGGLTCYKCGLTRRRVKLYLNHVETCDGSQNYFDTSMISNDLNTTEILEEDNAEKPTPSLDRKEYMTCGVCKQVVPGVQWIEHISKEHDYMAWEDGETVLDLEDSEAVRSHLYNIAKQNGGLVCKKCGITRKYVKSYVEHIKECAGVTLDCSKLDGPKENSILLELSKITTRTVVCGVCKTAVKKEDWVEHMSIEHEYLAWIDGQTPIDPENNEDVQRHLLALFKLVDGFKCAKCDLVRKYVKSYMQHIKVCQANSKETVMSAIRNNEMVECAICHEQINPKDWSKHAMKKHYNIAWVVGDPEVDLNNPYAVEGFIKEYQQKYTKLICKVCGISRVSRVGFYAHILTCGKSEEAIEMFKAVCEICNNKYLRIYKSQHMTAHRESEFAKERKSIAADEKRKKKNEEPVELLSGRRKAAEKAKTVIEKYKNGVSVGCHRCTTCGFSTEIESELSGHVCVEYEGEDFSDSDVSVNMDQWSDNESVDTDVDSNLSEEELLSEEHGSRKKRHSDASSAARIQRLPFPVHNPRSYLKQSGRQFIETYWSTEDLFTQWRSCEYKAVNKQDEANYLPPIAESCQIRSAGKTDEWTAYSRFEAKKEKPCVIIFVGAAIRSIAWAPSDRAVSDGEPHYLAVACHVAHDEPREAWEDSVEGPALIQIWDYGNMRVAPEFVLGIALDYGTVWAMDWCPSGTRDAPDQPDKNTRRLGLLATACSNGCAYIFSVPYPSTITEKDKLFYKLKPVAELRLTMSAERKVYPATSLKWSPEKGHGHILVGYSDGTMAYYDLNIESPILKTTENNVTILYPYYDDRFLNGCIEGVDVYPCGAGGAGGAGAACGASAAGGGLARGGRPRAALADTHVAAARAAFLPHWPSAMLTGDDALLSTSVSEMEWWGGGRRFGGARAVAGCVRCGRAALAQHRLLRQHTAHPLYPDLHKLVIGKIEMIPLNDKKKRKQNDELSMVVEPTTYESAVKKYGVEYQLITSKDRVSQQKVSSVVRQPYPERFPLADMTSLAFCTSEQHHDKLAVAVHAGFVLIVTL